MTVPVVRMFDADTLNNCVAHILDTIVLAGDDLPGSQSLPGRQLLSPGGATWDCDMVYVSPLSLQLGLPEGQQAGGFGGIGNLTFPPGANMSIWALTAEMGIVRKVNAVYHAPRAAPTEADYATDTVTVSSDTAVLVNAAATLAFGGWRPVPASGTLFHQQGGFAGVAVTVTTELFYPEP
jgi:hypothetical protein